MWDRRFSAATDVDIVQLSPHCTAAWLLLNPHEGLLLAKSWSGRSCGTVAGQGGAFLLWLSDFGIRDDKRKKTNLLNIELRGRRCRLDRYESDIWSSKVLITQGLIKNLITDCLRAAADLLPQFVNILILQTPATKAVVMEARPSARQRQVSSWPARTHTIIFWA